MVGLTDLKQGESAFVGYCVNFVTLIFDLIHEFDIGVSGIVGLIDVKRN